MEHIKHNLEEIRANIEGAAKKSGRNPSDICLIAVSKTFSEDYINYAASLGIEDFGENKVQELCQKHSVVENPINWHMIGHLQTNKVKYAVGKITLIQSVDSIKLAEEIDRISRRNNIVTDYLIEVNIADEPSKFGVPPDKAIAFAENISELANIRLRGLMCIAPDVENYYNREMNRKYFSNLRKLYVDIVMKNYHNSSMEFLSMGMTNDYITAIEEGSNMVRVGTGLFGKR